MKILITGANGFLGRGVVTKLLDYGMDVVAVDFNTNLIDSRAVRIDANIFEIENPYEKFGRPDILLHMAWRDGFIHYSINHMNDLPAHYMFLKKMVESDIKKIVVMGSMHEIGFYEGSINEDTPCHPMSLYGISKNALRNCVEMLTDKTMVKWQWLRGYYIVANTSYGSSVFSKIKKASDEGQVEFPFTKGQNQFDFIDYDEFCYQVAMAVMQDDVLGIINICSGHPEKLADRVNRFIDENKLNIRLRYGAFPDRPYDSKAVWGDNRKISKIIGK
jgi:dTDP-6-deoxy-L-talose 4-dehydrogenase (NAD+)